MKRAIFLGAFFAFAALSLPAQASDAALRALLNGRYTALNAAIEARNDAAIKAVLAPDFTTRDVSGKQADTTLMLGQLKSMPVDPNRVGGTTILSVKQDGAGAHVEQRYEMTTMKMAAGGSHQNIELVTLSSDDWIKSGGNWLLHQNVTHQTDVFVDGKSVLHKTSATTP